MQEKCVFVTVGTTKFEKLVKIAGSKEFSEVLRDIGYTRLVVQYGRGSKFVSDVENNDLKITSYSIKDDISEDLRSSTLVISHAGAGSCLEALELRKKLVIVTNDKLMDNHQTELARRLQDSGYALCCTPEAMVETAKLTNSHFFREMEDAATEKFCSYLDSIV